jgi:alkylhydroperoxidase family enzyme
VLLTATDLRLLVEAALVTRSGELGCDTCLDHVAAYAELRLTGIGWEADDQHFHSGHTRADPEAKAIYRSAVSTT